MSAQPSIDTLFPLLLKTWKDSWVEATNSAGELKCQVEKAWGEGFADGDSLIAAMDAAGVRTVLATDLLAWSYRRQARFAADMTEEIAALTKQYPGRVYGLASYDPTDIRAGVDKVERDVKERGYKGVYIHAYGYDLPLDHRKYYPLYSMCEANNIPVSMQTGHVLEAMPSEHGRPIQLDRIACDFPNLTLIGTHTGWPWVEELISVATKWPTVYISLSAWLPQYISPSLTRFMSGRAGRSKVLYGSNGLSWERYNQGFEKLDIDPDALAKIMCDNAVRVFNLE